MPFCGSHRFSTLAAYLAAVSGLMAATGPTSARADCPNPAQALGVSRTVEIDTTGGPLFGFITKQTHEKSFLAPKEVVLTFDDGPMPGVTRPILDTLDRFCTRATFVSVGQMALAFPEQVREILRRGHTLGTHTWSHPMNLRRLKGEQARDQIENGFAAVTLAAGQPIAPFFRFPGLNDSPSLLAHLERRDIATFTVDVVSNDSYIHDPGRLIERTLRQLEIEQGGIMLFHDIKPQTARALPTILAKLKSRGYRVVHMRAKAPVRADENAMAALRQRLAARNPSGQRPLVAITDAMPVPAPAPTIPQAVAAVPVQAMPAALFAPAPVEAVAPAPTEPAGLPTADHALHRLTLAERPGAPSPALSQPSPVVAAAGPDAPPAARDPAPDATSILASAPAMAVPEAIERTHNRRKQRDVPAIEQAIEAQRRSDARAATPIPEVASRAPGSSAVAGTAGTEVTGAPMAEKQQKPQVTRSDSAKPEAVKPEVVTDEPATAGQPFRIINSERPLKAEAAPSPPREAGSQPTATVLAPVAAPAAAQAPSPPPAVQAPPAAAAAPESRVEVIAGTYAKSASPAAATVDTPTQVPTPSEQVGRFAAPEIIAGSYRPQAAPAAAAATAASTTNPARAARTKRDEPKPRIRDAN